MAVRVLPRPALLLLLPLIFFSSAAAGAVGDVPPGVRAALLDLYHSTGGARWAVGWNTSAPACAWYGVGCDGGGNVITM